MPLPERSRVLGNGGYRRNPDPGTPLAIYYYTTGGASFSAPPDNTGEKQRRSTWGGSRNRGDRTSDFLEPGKAAELAQAALFASRIGLPLNRFITVHWEAIDVPDRRAAWATGKLVKLISDWVRSRGGSCAWLWTREGDYGDGSKGSHVHILMHVPDGLDLRHRPRGWLKRISDVPYRKGAVFTRRVGGTAGAALSAPAVYEPNLHEVLGYVCKGAPRETLAALRLNKCHQPGGRIMGKRSATSQNIGRTARQRWKG